ncbi:g patch domain-containing protein 11 [Caerostris extrusa]|uniref:G patch domain-containing protein 11 n=1 Tax=Caerostris extrusa TaxID=172846 RepID=A0AAV4NRY1_CAEEX|nr:g patch domain-containing protein 11 [Caerostris extrusa]
MWRHLLVENYNIIFYKMSDEEDYMSMAFLDTKEDIRPGLLRSNAKRKREIEKKRVESNKLFKTKSRKELEEESRSAGLDSAIGSDNKGFAMLQKMGYKPGTKLGPEKKHNPDSGLIEPIKIQVKANRSGLGTEAEIQRRIKECETRWKKVRREKESQLLSQFRERMRNKRDDKRLMGNLKKCQKVCEHLDAGNDVKEPMRSWFWFSNVQKDDDDEEEEEEEEYDDEKDDDDDDEEVVDLSPEEKVDLITEYIRHKYFYCFWCGIKYNDEEDLNVNCPGPDEESHEDL